MSNSERGIVVDIGGGRDGRAMRLARQDPNTSFFIFDPQGCAIPDIPENVYYVSQAIDVNARLPFGDSSVYEIYLDYLMGEVLSDEDYGGGSVADCMRLYSLVVLEAVRVLNPEGSVLVMDVQNNMEYVREVFDNCGFYTTKPRRVENREASAFTETFFRTFFRCGKSEAESAILPMELVATKKY